MKKVFFGPLVKEVGGLKYYAYTDGRRCIGEICESKNGSWMVYCYVIKDYSSLNYTEKFGTFEIARAGLMDFFKSYHYVWKEDHYKALL